MIQLAPLGPLRLHWMIKQIWQQLVRLFPQTILLYLSRCLHSTLYAADVWMNIQRSDLYKSWSGSTICDWYLYHFSFVSRSAQIFQPQKTSHCAPIADKPLRKIPHYNGLKRVTAWLWQHNLAALSEERKRERGMRGSSTPYVTLGLTRLRSQFSLSSGGFLWNNVAPRVLLPIQFHSKSLPTWFSPADTLRQTAELRSSMFDFS